ncbi:MAG TPA: hypothetical protein VGH82_05420 [Gaiellaceae bacterium]|jgi:hypothetical protein
MDPFSPLRERSISDKVINDRNYLPYFGKLHALYDPETVKAAFASFDLTQGQRATNTRFTNDARDTSFCPVVNGKKRCAGPKCRCVGRGDGLIMFKFPFPGEDPILPQLRPREAVYTGTKTTHQHNKSFSDPDDLKKHLDQEHGDWWNVEPDEEHEHWDTAKYLLQSEAKESRPHDHLTDPAFAGPKGRQKLIGHLGAKNGHRIDKKKLRNAPTGILLQLVRGEHEHRRPIPRQNIANRIDIGPWGDQDFLTAERIYLVKEGTPKNDAIRSRLDVTGELAAVCNVPSVTLAKCPELARVARRYFARCPLVVLVVDADWHGNPRVVRHALLLREKLANDYGVQVCIAAPPGNKDMPECKCKPHGHVDKATGFCSTCSGYFKGVDDFLAAGGELDGLNVMDRQADFPLALHAAYTAGKDGKRHTLRGPIWSYLDILRCRRDPERVLEALQNEIARGRIVADKPLELDTDEWSGALKWRGSPEDAPVFTIPEEHQHRQEFVRLGDFDPVPSFQTILKRITDKALLSSRRPLEKGNSDTKPVDDRTAHVNR